MAKGTAKYIVGKAERFDQKNEMFRRGQWDPRVSEAGKWNHLTIDEKRPGYTLLDSAFRNHSWYATVGPVAKELYAWEGERWAEGVPTRPPGVKVNVGSPAKMAKIVKKVAKHAGASLVGICELDRRWVYSYSYPEYAAKDADAELHKPVEIPDEYKYAISLAFEMDYECYRYSPTHIEGGTTGLGYSRMAFTSGLIAQFIRNMGYKAIPAGNETALSIPIAIDAGLGELARSGLLITPDFGPRVRLAKVITDLPLVADEPIEFGVWEFCQKCQKCAENCPSQAIMYGDPTTEIHNMSNNEGLLRWPIDAEKCLGFWRTNGTNCGTCIRVCPFNKPEGWLHSLVRYGVKHTPWMDSVFVKMDDLLRYGRKGNAAHFWDS